MDTSYRRLNLIKHKDNFNFTFTFSHMHARLPQVHRPNNIMERVQIMKIFII